MADFDVIDTPELKDFQASFVGGEFLYGEPHLAPRNACRKIIEAILTTDGAVKNVPGLRAVGPGNIDMGTKRANGLFFFERDDFREIAAIYGTELYMARDTGDANTPYNWARRASNVSVINTLYVATQARAATTERLYLVPCISSSRTSYTTAHVSFIEASSYSAMTIIGQSHLAFPRGLLWFQYRLWTIKRSTLHWSAVNQANTNGSSFANEDTGEDENMALVGLREPTPRIVVFRKRSVWLLDIQWAGDGRMPLTSNTLDFIAGALYRPIIQDVGLVAPRAYTWIPGSDWGDYLFLAEDGIRSLKRSLTDVQSGAGLPLSTKIQWIMDRVSWGYPDRAQALFHDGIAYFALPVDGSEDPNIVVAYDPRRNQWFEREWQVGSFCRLKYPSRKPAIYFQSAVATEENYTNPTTYVDHRHIYDTSTGLRQLDRFPLRMNLETRGYAFDVAEPVGSGIRQKKRWGWLDMGIRVSETTASFAIDYRFDGSTSWSAFTAFGLNSAEGVQRKRISLRALRPSYMVEFRIRDGVGAQDHVPRAVSEIEYFQVAALPYNSRFGG